MKKAIVFGFCAAFAAVLVAAYSNKATAPAGTDNVAFGYGAGYQSSGGNENVICIGTDSGAFSGNNTDCIFIGNKAGKDFTGRTGDVVIGDVFVHTNGVTSIKGLQIGHEFPFYCIDKHGNRENLIDVDDEGILHVMSNTWLEFDADPGCDDETRIRLHEPANIRFYEYNPDPDDIYQHDKDRTLMEYFQHPEWWDTENTHTMADYGITDGLCDDDLNVKVPKLWNGNAIGLDPSGAIGRNSIGAGLEANAHNVGSAAFGGYAEAFHDYAFIWNGDTTLNDYYASNGTGTFNICPAGGLDGFYLGTNTMRKVIHDEIAKPNAALKFTDEDTAAEYTIKFKAGQLCVFTNGVKIGTLTFTPVQ